MRLTPLIYSKFILSVLGALSLGVLSGCASGPRTNNDAIGHVIRESDRPSSAERDARAASVPGQPLEVWGQKIKNTTFDYPVIVNPRVEHWISYFTGKGRRYFTKYLERGRYFIPEIAKVLRASNMPQDLVYLAMIESGFNNSARSHAKAVGPWQFIRGTGRRYGLAIDYWLDERRDTRKSTMAAIKYLRELYEEFGSWELAAAGYNAGEGKVRRAIAKYKTSDFWQIARHRFFRPETRDYVPKIMAAAIISKNPEQFGFEDPFARDGKSRNPTILLDADVAEADEVTPKELEEPIAAAEETADDPAEPPAVNDVEVDTEVASEDGDESDDVEHAAVSSGPNPVMTPSVYMVANPNEQILEFEVKGPADLFAISKASGLPYSSLKLLNPEVLRWLTPPYAKTYRIKLPASVKSRFLATYNDASFDRRVAYTQYKVQRGDSLKSIARRFKTETDAIREVNSPGTGLAVGKTINLPIPTGYKRVIASMYEEKPIPSRKRRRRAKRVRKADSSRAEIRHHSRVQPKLRRIAETSVQRTSVQ
ncbi:MAG TPA: transglycosylase SLT domain-containing protein [Oligoflexia bacterium]|nr:transglycosylase SLT domain-containing protein [Oligoflexia bacterium]